MSIEQTQAWAHRQAGKPYVFPLTGPDAYDCSGFTSALINFVLGKANPYTAPALVRFGRFRPGVAAR
jgi:cell wall-associated NlpC family hydrolase